MRVIEVILATLIIVTAFSFTNILAIAPTSHKYEATELEKLGYNVLHELDQYGVLPRFVYNEEWENLTAALRVSLPIDIYFNATIYDSNWAMSNNATVFYGNIDAFVTSKNIASVTYALIGVSKKLNASSYTATYDPRTVVLQLVRG